VPTRGDALVGQKAVRLLPCQWRGSYILALDQLSNEVFIESLKSPEALLMFLQEWLAMVELVVCVGLRLSGVVLKVALR
jgi:hypothetical protein